MEQHAQGGEESDDAIRTRSVALLTKSLLGKREHPCKVEDQSMRTNHVGRPAQGESSKESSTLDALQSVRFDLISSLQFPDIDMLHVLALLQKLDKIPMTTELLRESKIGRDVNQPLLRNSTHAEVALLSRSLISRWRQLVRAGDVDTSAGLGQILPADRGGDVLGPGQRRNEQLHQQRSLQSDLELANASQEQDELELVWGHVCAACCAASLEAAVWTVAQQETLTLATSQAASRSKVAPATTRNKWSSIAPKARREYASKVRLLAASLRRLEGEGIRRRMLDGDLSAEEVAIWHPEELLPLERRAALAQERTASLQGAVVTAGLDLYSDRLQCPKCGARGARYALPSFTGHWSMKHETGKAILAQCPECVYQWQQQEGF